MAGDERQSPRAAIRNWLDKTINNSKPVPNDAGIEPRGQDLGSRHHSIREEKRLRPSIEPTGQCDGRHLTKRRGHRESREVPERDMHTSIPQKSHGEEHARKFPELRLRDSSFAEALGLHMPFRNFREQDDDPGVNEHGSVHPRKRRRKASSTASYLEPAVPSGVTDSDSGQQMPDGRLEPSKQSPSEDEDNRSSSGSSQRTVTAKPCPEKPTKSYERRPRHKTREDRYELKEGTGHKKRPAKDEGQKKKKKKHKRKEKSGAALMQSFTAQNVSRDRLTLQPAKPLGFFGKGRASSPVKRRGLPDLAFSETAFLKSRRAQPEDPVNLADKRPPVKKKPRKSTKAADTQAEMSRYFTLVKVSTRDALKSRRQSQQPEVQRQPQNYDLPGKPCLGFGSCGVSVSPARKLDSRTLRDLERRLTRSRTRSTSYFTWSQSGIRSQVSQNGSVAPLETSRHSDRRRSPPAPAKPERLKPPISPLEVRTLSGDYHDATTGTTPPSRNSNGALNAATAPLPLNHGRDGSGIHARGHHKTAQARFDHDEPSLESARAMPTRESAGSNAPEQSEPGLHKPLPSDTTQPCTKLKPRDGGPERNAQASVTRPAHRSAFPPPLDPLELVLKGLLQENSHHGTTNAVFPRVESLGRRDPQQANTFRPNRSARIPSQRIHFHPQVGEASGSGLPLEYVASGLDFVDGRSQHRQGSTNLGHKAHSPTHTMSRHGLRSSTRPNTMDYTLDPPPSPKTNRVDSRNAWKGYDTIYQRQQDMEDPLLIESQSHRKEHENGNSQASMQPRSDGDLSAHPLYEPDDRPIGVEDRSNDYGPGLYEGQDSAHNAHAYAEQAMLYEDYRDERYDPPSTWNEIEQRLFAEHHHDLGPGDFTNNHDNEHQSQDVHTGYQYPAEQTIDPRGLEQHQPLLMNVASVNTPWRSTFGSNFPNNGHRALEATASVRDGLDDSALSSFWTPHKLY